MSSTLQEDKACGFRRSAYYVPLRSISSRSRSLVEHARLKLLYNELAPFYDLATCRNSKREAAFLHKTIRSLNPKAAHIMDLGCGIGRLAEVLHKKYGYLVTGIDLSRAMALLARQRCPECDFIRMDIRCLGLNMDFDVAICMWTTFNYLSVKEDIAKFFAGVSRSLKASGLLFVDMNNHGLRDKRNYSREARNDSYLVKVEIRKRVVGDLNEGIYYYRIRNLKTGKEISARDQEISKIYTLETIASAACPQFDFLKAYGDYDVSAEYVPSSSDRIIAVFRRNERQLQTETSEEHAHVRQT